MKVVVNSMKNIDTCVSSEFKLPQKACNKCALGVMDGNNFHLWNKCFCDCHKMNGINECEDITEAFQLGYENWCEPYNPYVIGSNEHVDYESGVKQAIDEQY